MIKKITLKSSKEKFNKFYEQRGSRVLFWKCLNCGKHYNSENAYYKKRDSFIGFDVRMTCCPYCKIEQGNHKSKWLKSEMKQIIIYGKWTDKGREKKVIHLKSQEEIKKLKEVLK